MKPITPKPRLQAVLATLSDFLRLGLAMLLLCVFGVFIAYSLSLGFRWLLTLPVFT